MNDLETKQAIQTALAGFAAKPLADAATALFESLSYKSQKRIVLKPNTAKTFTENFAKDRRFDEKNALLADWQPVDFLFQPLVPDFLFFGDDRRVPELIKDCIHGVDIQPAVIQISKLRFFLSPVVEQNDPRHVRPLPNLETKCVCANSLLGLPRPEGWELFQHQIEPHERALLDVRARYFFAQNQKEKDACRAEDLKLRRKLSEFIEGIGGSAAHELASAVAAWNPYKRGVAVCSFDPPGLVPVGPLYPRLKPWAIFLRLSEASPARADWSASQTNTSAPSAA